MHGENDRNSLASTAVGENGVYLIGIASSTSIGFIFELGRFEQRFPSGQFPDMF